ncbi:MAG TPA: hypothetical protein ACFYD4_16715 [Candidatus Wunengus sp. YC61]|uniref:hypothetical protein n=1 Tax=Candidatus Wunengus sp. YC61 TaxID=3367698 RepID=UPI0040261886
MTDRIVMFCSIVLVIFGVMMVAAIIRKCAIEISPPPGNEIRLQQPTKAEKAEINRLFKKHGVQTAKEGKDDQLYFERDGQVCEFK